MGCCARLKKKPDRGITLAYENYYNNHQGCLYRATFPLSNNLLKSKKRCNNTTEWVSSFEGTIGKSSMFNRLVIPRKPVL